MADGQNEDVEMMEEDGWEYYDDNDVLTDFWQVRLLTGQTNIYHNYICISSRTSSRTK